MNENDTNKKFNKDEILSSFRFSTVPNDAGSLEYRDFTIHIFCKSGTGKAAIGRNTFEIVPDTVTVILNNKGFYWMEISDDFQIEMMLISNKFLAITSPETNYNVMGMLSLMENPVVKMNHEEYSLCSAVGNAIKERLKHPEHTFFLSVLRKCVETLILDLYNIRSHSQQVQVQGNSSHGMKLFRTFISMLERGDYRREREVRWYAEQLGITPKYLSEVCINASGHSASNLINTFTIEEIARLLHNPTMSINTIATHMNFATRSYFSHYVKERLGKTPKDFRLQVLGMK